MNKRIQELIERAEYQAKKQSGYEDWEVYVPPDSQVVFEKFAELIVQECMDKIQEVRQIKAGHPTPDYEQGMNDGMFVAIRTIEEHFGVEE